MAFLSAPENSSLVKNSSKLTSSDKVIWDV
jgi:hypothetical protein